MHGGEVRDVAAQWDRTVQHLSVARDGQTLLATASDLGQTPLFAVNVASGAVTRLSGPGYCRRLFARAAWQRRPVARPRLASRSLSTAREMANGANSRAQTPRLLAARTLGEFEQFSFAGWNDEKVYGYLVNPPDFDKGRKYPIAFIVHGGPQVSFQNHWNWRWNAQAFAARGYAAVFIDFHGSPGYGQAFTDAISQHWGDRPFEDLKKGFAAALQKFPWLDGQRACSLGASYGGYMQNWIAGNWPDGFRCIVNHDGIFDTRSMYFSTEELWFAEWENGGPYYDAPEIHERFNPVQLRQEVAHADAGDPRRTGFSRARYSRARDVHRTSAPGVESKLLYFPDENHWV